MLSYRKPFCRMLSAVTSYTTQSIRQWRSCCATAEPILSTQDRPAEAQQPLTRRAGDLPHDRLAIGVYGVPTGYIVIGGGAQCTDTATGLLLTVPLAAPVACAALSPLTTLAAALLEVRKPDAFLSSVLSLVRVAIEGLANVD